MSKEPPYIPRIQAERACVNCEYIVSRSIYNGVDYLCSAFVSAVDGRATTSPYEARRRDDMCGQYGVLFSKKDQEGEVKHG